MDKLQLKSRERKLKAPGLSESPGKGNRPSARGRAALQAVSRLAGARVNNKVGK